MLDNLIDSESDESFLDSMSDMEEEELEQEL